MKADAVPYKRPQSRLPVLSRAYSRSYKRAFRAYWAAFTEPFGGVAEGTELRLLVGRVCALGAEYERAAEELAIAQGQREKGRGRRPSADGSLAFRFEVMV